MECINAASSVQCECTVQTYTSRGARTQAEAHDYKQSSYVLKLRMQNLPERLYSRAFVLYHKHGFKYEGKYENNSDDGRMRMRIHLYGVVL